MHRPIFPLLGLFLLAPALASEGGYDDYPWNAKGLSNFWSADNSRHAKRWDHLWRPIFSDHFFYILNREKLKFASATKCKEKHKELLQKRGNCQGFVATSAANADSFGCHGLGNGRSLEGHPCNGRVPGVCPTATCASLSKEFGAKLGPSLRIESGQSSLTNEQRKWFVMNIRGTTVLGEPCSFDWFVWLAACRTCTCPNGLLQYETIARNLKGGGNCIDWFTRGVTLGAQFTGLTRMHEQIRMQQKCPPKAAPASLNPASISSSPNQKGKRKLLGETLDGRGELRHKNPPSATEIDGKATASHHVYKYRHEALLDFPQQPATNQDQDCIKEGPIHVKADRNGLFEQTCVLKCATMLDGLSGYVCETNPNLGASLKLGAPVRTWNNYNEHLFKQLSTPPNQYWHSENFARWNQLRAAVFVGGGLSIPEAYHFSFPSASKNPKVEYKDKLSSFDDKKKQQRFFVITITSDVTSDKKNCVMKFFVRLGTCGQQRDSCTCAGGFVQYETFADLQPESPKTADCDEWFAKASMLSNMYFSTDRMKNLVRMGNLCG